MQAVIHSTKMKRSLILLAAILPFFSLARADQFVTGQAVSSALGQVDLVSASTGSSQSLLSNPRSVAVDPTTGKVFVADSSNSRILRFSSTAALSNGSDAEAVIGQPDFSSNLENQGGAATASTFFIPLLITVDINGRLWVADQGNHRVLGFLGASSLENNPTADFVFGQPDFTTRSRGTSSATMDAPTGVAIGSDDSLWVVDSFNHRVLRFANITSKISGASADSVLGQSDFTLNLPGTSATQMRNPYSVSVDSAGRIWVADSENFRVLRFDNAASMANGSPANGVLGQASFSGGGVSTTSANSLNRPSGVLAGPDGTLYVADSGDRRITGFRNAASKANGAAADFVLGKPNFTATATGLVPASATLLFWPGGLSLSPEGHLYVSDSGDHRVVRFVPGAGQVPGPVPVPNVTIRTRKGTTTAASFTIKGTAAGQVTQVTYRIGKKGPFKKAGGTSAWSFRAKLAPGKNRITVIAQGPGGSSTAKTVTITRK